MIISSRATAVQPDQLNWFLLVSVLMERQPKRLTDCDRHQTENVNQMSLVVSSTVDSNQRRRTGTIAAKYRRSVC